MFRVELEEAEGKYDAMHSNVTLASWAKEKLCLYT